MMKTFQALNPDFANVVRSSVMSFPVSRFIGFEFGELTPGHAELLLPCREELTQGSGIVQAGIVGLLADIASGSAAGTLLPRDHVLVTCDYTVKLLAPARGDRLIARGEVIKPGASLTVSRGDVFAVRNDQHHLCATALITTMMVKMSG